MIATSRNMVHGALRTIIIHEKRILNQTGASNTLRPGKYVHRFVHNISKCISPMRLIYFVPGLTQISNMMPLSTSHLWFKILAWHRIGVMPLYETKMALLTFKVATRKNWCALFHRQLDCYPRLTTNKISKLQITGPLQVESHATQWSVHGDIPRLFHSGLILILGLHPANERRRYKVTPSLNGWVQTYNQPCPFIWITGLVKQVWSLKTLRVVYRPSSRLIPSFTDLSFHRE